MRRGRAKGRGGMVAVAAASALGAVCLAGGPLYISSTASEAVQVGLDRTCLADAGVQFHVATELDPTSGVATARAGDVLDAAAAGIANVQVPIITDLTEPIDFHAVGDDSPSSTRVIVVSRENQHAHLDSSVDASADGEAVVPEWDAEVFGVGASDQIELTVEAPLEFVPDSSGGSVAPAGGVAGPRTVPLAVTSTYADIPTRPEPSYWCAQRDLFRLKPSGDRPLPVAFVNEATIRELSPTRIWELRPDPHGLTRHEAEQLIADFTELTREFEEANSSRPRRVSEIELESELPALVRRAELAADVVARTIAPIRLGGIGAAALLLVAAGVLLARERRQDLRLRLLRGVGPLGIGARLSAGVVPAVVIGSALGALTAFLAVQSLGPTPEFEPDPTRVALIATTIGAVVAIVLVGAVGSVATSRTVDARTRHRRHRIPWELVLVPLAVVSYIRLDRVGGVRLVGSEARGGDFLAQAFPILALAAPLAIIARPLTAAVRRSRRWGAGAPVPALFGLRRVAAEPGASTMMCLAVAFAVGAFVVSGSLTASAEQLLEDKTNTYLGGDMVVRTRSLDSVPRPLEGLATPIALVNATVGGRGVDLVGIDPDTFADAVHWREDASDMTLADLVRSIEDDSGATTGPLKAIVVGDLGGGVVETKSGDELPIDTVAEPAWFPGLHAGSVLVVVDADALRARELAKQSFMWLTDPPADTEQILRDNGTVVLNIRESADVFEVTSFLTVRWSYAVLAAFGVLVAIAALLAQLLVLDARRSARQATWTLTSKMGMSLGNEATAIVTEVGVPLAMGLVLGLGLGWLAVAIAVAPLDSIRHLEPPARVIIDLGSVAGAILASVAALIVLAALGLISVIRTRPMEVMRGGN